MLGTGSGSLEQARRREGSTSVLRLKLKRREEKRVQCEQMPLYNQGSLFASETRLLPGALQRTCLRL